MKQTFLFTLLSSVMLLAGCATTEKTADTGDRVRELRIVSALYGQGTSFADVGPRVLELLRSNEKEFFARPEWLKIDPSPGWNKTIVIACEYRGRRNIFTAGEGGRVSYELLLDKARKPSPVSW